MDVLARMRTCGIVPVVVLEDADDAVATAKAMLKEVYPEWAEKIDLFMPDEKARRLGQSVAAAQIPVIRR